MDIKMNILEKYQKYVSDLESIKREKELFPELLRLKKLENDLKEQELISKKIENEHKKKELLLKDQELVQKQHDTFVRYQDILKYADEIKYVSQANEQIVEGLRLKNVNERIDILHNLGLKMNEDSSKILKFSELLGLKNEESFENLVSDKIKKSKEMQKSLYN
jgi:hypothetical protein